jgi:hypothetical protein
MVADVATNRRSMKDGFNAIRIAWRCAVARLRDRPGRVVLAALGVAVSAGSIIVISFASIVAGDVALRRGLTALPTDDQAIISAYAPEDGLLADDIGSIDAAIRAELQGGQFGPTRSLVEYRALSNKEGAVFRLAGVSDLQGSTRLVAGTWPQQCGAERCEVVAVRETAVEEAVLPLDPALGLVVVGQVIAQDPLLLAGGFAPERGEVVLLAGSVDGVARLQPLQYIRRSYGWITPLQVERLRVSDVASVLRTMARLAGSADVAGVEVKGPDAALVDGRVRAAAAGNRLAVPAASSLTLFAAFTIFAGLGLRPDHRRALAVLARRGGSPVTLSSFTVLETGFVVVVGGLLGVGAGLPIGRRLASAAGSDGDDAMRRVLAADTVRNVLVVLVLAWAVLVVVVRLVNEQRGRRRRVTGLDVAGLAAVVVVAVLIDRGAPSASELANRPDSGIAAIPVLAAIALVAVACRVIPPALRGWSALVPRSRALTRLSLGNATARPLRPLATASLIALTVMFGLFGLGYRSTLALGASDQAAFAVPYDFRITGGPALVKPREVVPSAGWNGLAEGVVATDVLRRGAILRVAGTAGTTTEVVGLNPSTLQGLHGWREQFGTAPMLSAASIDTAPVEVPGARLPKQATTLQVEYDGFFGIRIAVVIERLDGSWHEIDAVPAGPQTAVVELQQGDAGGQLIGFRVAQDREAASRTEHHIGEGDSSVGALEVRGAINSVSAHGEPIDLPWSTFRTDLGTLDMVSGGGVSLVASMQGKSALLVPEVPELDDPLPAIVDPVTASAARAGVVILETSDGRLAVRPISVVQRFPGSPARFVVVDVDRLQPLFDLSQPGFGTANEVWIGAVRPGTESVVAAALAADARLDVLQVSRRTEVLANLRDDPLARSTLAILVGSALAAAALAALALVVGALADGVDDRGLHRTLALEGVSPRRLMGFQSLKTWGLVAIAIPVGVAGGAALLQMVTRTVAVTATASVPEPALRLSMPVVPALLAVVAFCCLAGACAWLGARPLRRVPTGDLLRGGE